MLKRLFVWLKGFIGRVTEVTGVVLALFAAYEMVIANRIAPHVVGSVWLCPQPRYEDEMTRDAFFAFLRENADSVVYLDFWFSPVTRTGGEPNPACIDNGQVIASDSEHGLYVLGTSEVFEDGSGGAQGELRISYADFNVPQTARLTGQSGEEPIFGVTGLVYVEAGEVEMGFQEFTLSAAPYADAVLKRRDCTRDYVAAQGMMDRARAYLFSCLAN